MPMIKKLGTRVSSKERIKQQQIAGEENADHAGHQRQHPGVILPRAIGDAVEAGTDRQRNQ